jgi:DNA-binding XRE family transcriptional regulator
MSESNSKKGGRTQHTRSVKGKVHGMPAHRVKGDAGAKRDPFLLAVGKAIVEARQTTNLSQVKLAAAADLGLQSVYFIEHAQSNTTLLTLRKIAHALGCSARDLLPLDDSDEALADLLGSNAPSDDAMVCASEQPN